MIHHPLSSRLGGWATAHLTPALKIEILGFADESRAPIWRSPEETVLGHWQYDEIVRLTLVRNGQYYTMESLYIDGGRKFEPVLYQEFEGYSIIRPKEEGHGEYWMISSMSSLVLMNKENKSFGIARKIGRDAP